MDLNELTITLQSLGVYLLNMMANPLNSFYEISWNAYDPNGSGDYRYELSGVSKGISLEAALRGILSDLAEDEDLPVAYRDLASTMLIGCL